MSPTGLHLYVRIAVDCGSRVSDLVSQNSNVFSQTCSKDMPFSAGCAQPHMAEATNHSFLATSDDKLFSFLKARSAVVGVVIDCLLLINSLDQRVPVLSTRHSFSRH